jgi:hypothetical protein
LAELGALAGVPLLVTAEGRTATHHYDINNERLSRVVPIASSASVAARFICEWQTIRA